MESLHNVFDYPTLPFSKGPSQDEQGLNVPSPKNNCGFPAPLLMLGVGEKKVMLQNEDCKERGNDKRTWSNPPRVSPRGWVLFH